MFVIAVIYMMQSTKNGRIYLERYYTIIYYYKLIYVSIINLMGSGFIVSTICYFIFIYL